MTSEIFSVWFLMGAALVFWMQAGFARVSPVQKMPATF